MKKMLSTLAIAGLLSGTAQATNRSITFDFDVFSSASRFTLCAAGIKHNTRTDQGGTPGDRNTSITGSAEQDLLEITNSKSETFTLQGTTSTYSFVEYFDSNDNDFDSTSEQFTEINNANLVLRSDVYGAEWYFEMCYWAPNIGAGDLPGTAVNYYQVLGSVISANTSDTSGYFTDSDLAVKITNTCDDSIDDPGFTSLSSLAADHEMETAGWTDGLLSDCKIRFTFKEQSTTERDHALETGSVRIKGHIQEKHEASVPAGTDL
jgi:hypothetical protein